MARKRENRGGSRTPARPAAASGPGRLARRTDGGPGGQPVRSFPARSYGERQALAGQQQAAPMAAGRPPTTPGSAGGRSQPPAQPLTAFGPTQRPNEPITAGIPFGAGMGPSGGRGIPNDTVLLLQAMAQAHPSPAILQLIKYAGMEAQMRGGGLANGG